MPGLVETPGSTLATIRPKMFFVLRMSGKNPDGAAGSLCCNVCRYWCWQQRTSFGFVGCVVADVTTRFGKVGKVGEEVGVLYAFAMWPDLIPIAITRCGRERLWLYCSGFAMTKSPYQRC